MGVTIPSGGTHMQPDLRTIPTGAPGAAQDFALQQHKVLRNTYMLLALSLIPTIIGAAIGTNVDLSFMRTSPMLSFVAILAIFYGWIYAIERNKQSALGVLLLLGFTPVSYTHLRAHETGRNLVCRLLLEKK